MVPSPPRAAALLLVLAALAGCKKKTTEVPLPPPVATPVEATLQVVAVSPATVVAGRPTSVMVVGAGFQSGATVRIGSQIADSSRRNENQLDVSVPPLAAGIYDVSVENAMGGKSTLSAGLTARPDGPDPRSAVDSCRRVILYFDTDSSSLTAESKNLLQSLVPCFNSTEVPLRVEGHADERDTTEYNLALGQRRASAVADLLVSAGVSRSRLAITSYGEERPAERGGGEAAWSRNRRVELTID